MCRFTNSVKASSDCSWLNCSSKSRSFAVMFINITAPITKIRQTFCYFLISSERVQSLVEIFQQIFDILDSHGDPHETWADAGTLSFLGRHGPMGSSAGQAHQCFNAA